MSATVVPAATSPAQPLRLSPSRAPQAPGRRCAFFFLLPNAVGFFAFTLTPLVASLVLSLFDLAFDGQVQLCGVRQLRRPVQQGPVLPRRHR